MNYTNAVMHSYAFRDYLQVRNYSYATITDILSIIKEFEDYISIHQSAKNYDTYLRNRNHKNNPLKKLETSTINYHYYSLRLYFSFLEQYQKEYSKSIQLLNYKKELKDITVLTISEVQQLFLHANSLQEQVLLTLLYHLGLRAGEVVNVKQQDINVVSKTILITKSKTGWQRLAPMHTTAAEILEHYIDVHKPTDYIIQSSYKNGGKLHVNSVQRILKRIANKAGITKRIYPHLLRHSIATHLLAKGMDFAQVSTFLGHRSAESTQRYTHIQYQLETEIRNLP
jgi:site-specific recombinase XerD